MENEFFKDRRKDTESPRNLIDNIAEHLGFVENEELSMIRRQAIESASIGDIESVKALLLEYQFQAEEQIDGGENSDYMHSQIALIIAKATLYRDTGNLDAFLENIRDAREYAFNIYDDKTVAVLEKAPSIEIARILSFLGGNHGFDEETIAEIAEEPYGQALEIAYGYLTQAGFDADEVLDQFIKDLDSGNQDSE